MVMFYLDYQFMGSYIFVDYFVEEILFIMYIILWLYKQVNKQVNVFFFISGDSRRWVFYLLEVKFYFVVQFVYIIGKQENMQFLWIKCYVFFVLFIK